MGVVVHHGDSREVLKSIPSNSVDSVVTDPPYALVSIVKRFGADDAAPAQKGASGVYSRASAGFMGQTWDTGETAFAVEFWAEVMRVLKPGGHIVAASGTRTYHRLAVAIEDAGFEIRDMISWLYGSGFPKSHDVSKGIDKAKGVEFSARPASGVGFMGADGPGGYNVTKNQLTRVGEQSPEAAEWEGWGTALKPACEPWVLARKPLIGTVAGNVLLYGTGALNIDGCRVDMAGEVVSTKQGGDHFSIGSAEQTRGTEFTSHQLGRWPANVIHDGSDEVVAAFPQTAIAGGYPANGAKFGLSGGDRKQRGEALQIDMAGGSAARFFYTAKADAEDRVCECSVCGSLSIGPPHCLCRDPEDSTKKAKAGGHPTVKPIDLMQYLCRLVTPKGGTILDPFAGSGTTGTAARREGFNAILIEREERFAAFIRHRLTRHEEVDLFSL